MPATAARRPSITSSLMRLAPSTRHDVDRRRRRPGRRTPAPAWWPAASAARRSSSENVLPCFQHSISRSSASTSPSDSETSAWVQRSPMAYTSSSMRTTAMRRPSTSKRRAVAVGASSSSAQIDALGHAGHPARRSSLPATRRAQRRRRSAGDRQLVEHLVEEADARSAARRPPAARRGSRGRSAAPRRSARRWRRGCSARRCSRSRGSAPTRPTRRRRA